MKNWLDRRAARRLIHVLRQWRREGGKPTADQFTTLSFLHAVAGNERKATLSAIRAEALRGENE